MKKEKFLLFIYISGETKIQISLLKYNTIVLTLFIIVFLTGCQNFKVIYQTPFYLFILNYPTEPKMRLLIIIILTIISFANGKMTINFRQSTIGTSIFWVRVKIAIMGGISPYRYQYIQLPDRWRQVNQFIYIPTEDLNSYNRYLCRLIVTDQTYQQLTASITLITQSGRVFVHSATYSYADQFQVLRSQSKQLKKKQQQKGLRIAQGKINNPTRPKQPQSQNQSYEERQNNNKNQQKNMRKQQSFDPFSSSKQKNSFSIQTQKKQEPKIIEDVQQNKTQQKQIEEKQYQPRDYQLLKTSIRRKNVQQVPVTKKIQQTLKNASKQVVVANRKIDQIFTKLPTNQELDQIILSADTLAISKTIQIILMNNMDCEQKIAYLSQFFGRIQKNVQVKKLSLKKLNLIKQLAQQQIQRLLLQFQRLNNQYQQLNLDQLKKRLKTQILKLEQAYDRYNQAVVQNSQAVKRLPSYQNIMQNLRHTQSVEKKAIQNELNQLQATSKQILQLQNKIKLAKQKQKILRNSIQQRTTKIKKLQRSLEIAMQQANETSNTIVNGLQNIDLLKTNYLLIEVQVGRIRKDIESNTNKQKNILEESEKIELQIQQEEQKINQREIEQIENMIWILQRNLPNIQQDIDELYYSCYDTSQNSFNPSNSRSYYIQSRQFIKYLERVYGFQGRKNIKNIQQKQINVSKTTIYSSNWEKQYGSALNQKQEQEQNLIENDFNCLRPSKLETRTGIISFISKNMITVDGDDENIYKLFLGSCSRLQSADSDIPKVGQRIIFKGNQDIQNQFKVYTASSY